MRFIRSSSESVDISYDFGSHSHSQVIMRFVHTIFALDWSSFMS